MPSIKADELLAFGVRIFVASGVSETTATELMTSLVLSNLVGVDSHGVVRIANYVNALKTGAIVSEAEAKVVYENEAIVLLDGCHAFGQIVSKKAMRLAMEKARRTGVGVSSFTNVYHVGRLGEFVEMAAQENMIGIMFVNGARPGGLVAPFGARQRVLGTNPIAFAVPAGSYPPLVADFATSAVAEGKVRIHHRKGEQIPFGWVVDSDGEHTNDPASLYSGGAILTFGEHKGSALSLLIEILGGILSGGNTPIFPDYKELNNGVFILVIEPSFFRDLADYRKAVDYLFKMVEEALPAHGKQGALIPGQPERMCKAIREKEGISIDAMTIEELRGIASALNIPPTLQL